MNETNTGSVLGNENRSGIYSPELREYLRVRGYYPVEPPAGLYSPVKWTCRCRTRWLSSLDDILRGIGCPRCGEAGFNSSIAATLFYGKMVQSNGDEHWTLGVSNGEAVTRFRPIDRCKVTLLLQRTFFSGEVALRAEQRLKHRNIMARSSFSDWAKLSEGPDLFETDIIRSVLEVLQEFGGEQ